MKRIIPLLVVILVLGIAGCTGGAKDETPSMSSVDLVTKGKEVFNVKGCDSCHTIDGKPGVGPTMKGLYMSKVELDNGQTVTADDAYILESIKDPNAKIVKGYNKGVMSAVVSGITDDEATALSEYIKSLK